MKAMNAKRVREIRKLLGLTGDQLGKELGVTGNTVRRWEMGIRKVKGTAKELLERMAEEAQGQAVAS